MGTEKIETLEQLRNTLQKTQEQLDKEINELKAEEKKKTLEALRENLPELKISDFKWTMDYYGWSLYAAPATQIATDWCEWDSQQGTHMNPLFESFGISYHYNSSPAQVTVQVQGNRNDAASNDNEYPTSDKAIQLIREITAANAWAEAENTTKNAEKALEDAGGTLKRYKNSFYYHRSKLEALKAKSTVMVRITDNYVVALKDIFQYILDGKNVKLWIGGLDQAPYTFTFDTAAQAGEVWAKIENLAQRNEVQE